MIRLSKEGLIFLLHIDVIQVVSFCFFFAVEGEKETLQAIDFQYA